jgi:glycosyltransferase involved in cell wall biosynthesis
MYRVYAANHARKRFACQYYRLDVPLRGLEEVYGDDIMTWNDILDEGIERATQGLLNSDFALFWGINGGEAVKQFEIMKNIPIGKDDGKLLVPPMLITDIDDNRDYIHPFNTSFFEQGVRSYPEYKLLKKGDRITTTDMFGKEIVIWEDGVTEKEGRIFNITKNIEDMRLTHKLYRASNGVTVTVEPLAKYMRDVIGCKHVHVFPNTIIPADYVSYNLVPKNEIRILWQGGLSHYLDWYPLRDAVIEVTKKYPNVKWVMFGEKFDWITDIIPPAQLEYHGWVDYAAYKLKRGLLQIDINLCPLQDDLFNRCKSAIKWYEASIWNKPEVTLASRVPPFSDEMTDNENGLLFANPTEFVQKLSILIEDESLRQRLAQSAREWVLNNRTPKQTIPPLWDFYKSLRDRRVGEFLLAQK